MVIVCEDNTVERKRTLSAAACSTCALRKWKLLFTWHLAYVALHAIIYISFFRPGGVDFLPREGPAGVDDVCGVRLEHSDEGVRRIEGRVLHA